MKNCQTNTLKKIKKDKKRFFFCEYWNWRSINVRRVCSKNKWQIIKKSMKKGNNWKTKWRYYT